MVRTFITVGGQEYCLAVQQNIAGLRDQIVTTVKSGGGMVEFLVGSGTPVTVLVAPGIGVLFRDHEVAVSAEAPPVPAASHADFDDY